MRSSFLRIGEQYPSSGLRPSIGIAHQFLGMMTAFTDTSSPELPYSLSAKCCELVGLYILDKLTNGDNALFVKGNCGIYRDDGLAIIDIGTFQAHTVKNRLEEIFKEEGLKIKVVANLTVTEFLDVRLNLETGEYRPFKKPGCEIVYIDSKSNHPPSVIKEMPG